MAIWISVHSAHQSRFCSGRAMGLQSELKILRLLLPIWELSHPKVSGAPAFRYWVLCSCLAEERLAKHRQQTWVRVSSRCQGGRGHAQRSCWRGGCCFSGTHHRRTYVLEGQGWKQPLPRNGALMWGVKDQGFFFFPLATYPLPRLIFQD